MSISKGEILSRNFLCFTLFMLSCYWLFDGITYRVTFSQKLFAGGILVFASMQTYLLVINGEKYPLQLWLLSLSSILLCFQGAIIASIRGLTNWPWFLADFSTWVFFPIFLFMSKNIGNRNFIKILKFFIFILFLFSIIVIFFGERNNNRCENPSVFLIAGIILLFWQSKTTKERFLTLSIHTVVGYMCFLSESRTHIAIWILISIVSILSIAKDIKVLSFICILIAGIGIYSLYFYKIEEKEGSLSEKIRLPKNFELKADESLKRRWDETNDVFRHILEEKNRLFWVFGFGHGAAYFPIKSNIIRNMGKEGTVHNIHLSPALILFRYGALGLLWYFFVFGYFLFAIFTRLKRKDDDARFIISLCIIVLSYFISSFFRNELADPVFIFTLSAAFSRTLVSKKIKLKFIRDKLA